jgi:CO dehydrogenase nickel-insertion accessory protein CooC1
MKQTDGVAMNREYKREYKEEDIERVSELTKIGVFSFIKTSGTSFVATSLAKYMADQKTKSVAYVELKHDDSCESLLYEALGMGQRFASRDFISFFEEIKARKYIKKRNNQEAGINWALRTPKDRDLGISLTQLEETRLLNNICGDWVVCDLGSRYSQESMEEMDILIGVIDPMPAKLLASKNELQKLLIEDLGGRRLLWVINKYNLGVNNKLLKRFLRLKNPIMVPLIPEEWFYVAQYHCRIPFEQTEIKKAALLSIEELVNRHIPFT